MSKNKWDRDKHFVPEPILYREKDCFLAEIFEAHLQARKRHGPFNSLHEAYGVLKEEHDELWDLIKLDATVHERAQDLRAEIMDCMQSLFAMYFECVLPEIYKNDRESLEEDFFDSALLKNG